MELNKMFNANTILLDLAASDQDELFSLVAQKLLDLKLIKNTTTFIAEVKKREATESTAMGDGIAIPHILNPVVNEARIVFVRTQQAIDWKSPDEKPVDLIFFIITSGQDSDEHLSALGDLAGVLMQQENIAQLKAAKKPAEVINVFKTKKVEQKATSTNTTYDVVGITACPTGIAHTYLAQEKIIQYAKELGLTAKVETQGRRGTEDKLSQAEIDNAKVIFLAHDKSLTGMGRFNNKKVIDTGTKNAIFKGKEILQDALNGVGVTEIHSNAKDDSDSELSLKKFKDIKGNLLAGVSRMLPFVVAGGIVLGIAFLIDFAAGSKGGPTFGTQNAAAGWFAALGKLSMQMMIPILGGYIAYSIVGPQGLMPGIIAGLTSSNIMSFSYAKDGDWANLWGKLLPFESHESGFIGAIFGAYLAALIVFGWTKALAKLPKGLSGARDIVFVPLLSILSTGVAMFVINIPIGYLMMELSNGISWLANHDLILLVSALFGIMMCFDMGGPINKIAYTLGTLAVGGQLIKGPGGHDATGALLGQQQILMAASLLAGMLPPLMIAICTVIFPRSWTAKDRDAAKVNWIMGACFVTEGAIPFMIKDPKRISASAMVGGLIIGLTVGLLKVSIGAPHGGIFVFALIKTGINNANYDLTGTSIGLGITFALAILLLSSLISAVILGFWRMADIKKGILVLDETNGVKESYDAKIKKLEPKNNNVKVQRRIGKYQAKIEKYSQYEATLQVKNAAYLERREAKAKIKAKN